MAGRVRFIAPIVLCSLVLAGLGVGATTASAAPKPGVPGAGGSSSTTHGLLHVTGIPQAGDSQTDTSATRMFAYAPSHFAAAAAKLPVGLGVALQRDLGLTTETYLADADADARAVQVVASLGDRGVTVLGSSMKGTTLTVNVATSADAALVRATGATARVGAPKPFAQATPAAPASGNDDVVYPGKPYLVTGTSASHLGECTVGFTGFKYPAGSTAAGYEPISAGHCLLDGTHLATEVQPVTDSSPGIFNETQIETAGSPFARPLKTKFGGGYDASMMAGVSGGSTATTTSETPNVATWGGQNANGTPNSSAPITLTGETQAIDGATLCKSGARTGFTCGTVLAVNYSGRVLDDSNHVQTVNSIIATTCILPGDSGGAAIIGTLAAGIDSFTSDGTSCAGADYFSGFFPMVAPSTKPSVARLFGSTWELQVVPDPPVITHPSSTGTILASSDSISGTFESASTGEFVALFFDGEPTTTHFAKVTSGNWSYPLSGLTSGPHTVIAESRSGHYSASSDVSTSFTVHFTASVRKPTISGTPKVGVTLTAKTRIVPSTGTVDYQWESDGVDVGADQATYAPVASDLGHRITVLVTGSATDYFSSSPVSSKSSAKVVKGTLTRHAPVVTGFRNVGQTLTATTADWGPGVVGLAYQWTRDGKKLANETQPTYVQQPTDRGHKFNVIVTGTLDGYTTSSLGSASTKIATGYPLFDAAPAPTIDNTSPSVLGFLTASTGTWSPGTVAFTYQWRENGHAISKATKPTYTIPLGYVNTVITVTVTGKEAGFATTSVTSAPTSAVASIPFTTIGTASIAPGATQVKGALWKVVTSGWSPAPTFSYVWMRDGVAIPHATHSSYKLTNADLAPASITVQVTAARTGYTTVITPVPSP